MSLRRAWATQTVPGQPGLHETLPKQQNIKLFSNLKIIHLCACIRLYWIESVLAMCAGPKLQIIVLALVCSLCCFQSTLAFKMF